MTIKDAVEYLNYCEKHGGADVDTTDMSDKQIIKLAQQMMDAGDAVIEAYQESHHDGHEVGECFVCRDGI